MRWLELALEWVWRRWATILTILVIWSVVAFLIGCWIGWAIARVNGERKQ